ncbi:hypothetical protein PGC35_15350 [Psychrobacillus sp. PGGUH221]|uniref:hypothetical protein n=1 Tax=Psychrobacillus sp. PGGUH221 TaxID=3020058 RepID=UPI0035C6DA55
MSQIEQLHSHILHSNTLPTCLETLSKIEDNDEVFRSLTEYGTLTYSRLYGVLNQLKLRIDSIDPNYFRLSVLNQINSDVNQINSYLQNPTTHLLTDSSLNNINTHLDNILAYLIQIPQISDQKEFEGIRENVTSFRRSVARHKVILEEERQQIIEKNEEIKREFEELNASFEALNNKFNTAYNELEEKFSNLHTRFLETEEERDNQFTQKMEEFQESTDAYFTEREEQWEELLDKNKDVFDKTIEELNTVHESFLTEIQGKQERYDEILIEHKKSVESIVGIISTNTISGHFKEVADRKYKLTTIWQWMTGGGFAATIGFGVYAFIFSYDLDWPSLVARFIVTTALGSFTAYAARQVTKNEAQEKYNRQMEVELKTLNPYIASFSEEDQIKLKEQFFPHIFGRAEVNKTSNDSDASTSSHSLNPQQIENINYVIETLKNVTGGQK